MKKSKLYALAAAALFGLNANAQGLADGEYYIKNVESSKFLSNGASWGTRSVLSDNGICYGVTKGGDGKYTLKSGIKGDAKALRPSDGFNDQSGAWDLIFEDDVVYMYNGSKYFCNDASNLPQFTDTKNDAAKWQFISKAQLLENLDNASESNPVDATFLIQAPDFLNADTKNSSWPGNKVGGDAGSGCSLINSTNCERWNGGTYTISQTLTGLPAGKYKLTAQGFYRHGPANPASANAYEGKSEVKSKLFAGTLSVGLMSVYAEAKNDAVDGGWASKVESEEGNTYYIPNSQAQAAQCFEKGAYVNVLENIVVTTDGGSLEIGVSREGAAMEDWTVFDTFRLTYYGPIRDFTSMEPAYTAAVGAAEGVDQTKPMNSTVLGNLQSAISSYNKDFSTFENATDIEEATKKLKDAAEAANTSINAYAAVAAKISVLDAAGKANFNASEVGQKYVNNTYVDEDITAAFVVATKAQTSEGADMSALAPATWSCAQGNGPTPQQGGFETFNSPTAFAAGKVMSQTISDLNKGLYKVEIQYLTHLADWNGQVGSGEGIAQIYANDATIDVEVIANRDGSIQPITIEALVKDGTLEYGIQNIVDGGCWYVAKFEKLTYVRPLTAAEEAVAPTSITLNAASADLKPGQQTTLSVAAFKPDDATATVTWSSSDDKVATVENGVVTAVGEGTATITATSAIDTSIKATATVSVAYPSELANASFDEADVATEKLGTNGSAANTMAVSEWTSKGGVWTAGAAFAYGSAATLNDAVIPEADETHKGNALGVSVGWGSEVVFSQTIKLPAGNYTISADAYNAGSATQGASKLGFVAANGTSYISDKNSYTIGEWETDKVTFKLTEATVGQIQIGLGAISGGSGSNAKVFFDNIVIASKTDAEIEAEEAAAAAKALAEAKDAKKTAINALAPIGNEIFQYSQASINTALANVDAATTKDAVDAVAIPTQNKPATTKAYMISLKKNGLYLTVTSDGIKLSETQQPLYFNGNFTIGNENGEYVAYTGTGSNTWSLGARPEGDQLAVTISNGAYTLKGKNGFFGLDNYNAGSSVYGNKDATEWVIAEYVAPTPKLAITDGSAISYEAGTEYDITYTRTGAPTDVWQGLYLPYSISADDVPATMSLYEVRDIIVNGSDVDFKVVKIEGDEVSTPNTPLMYKSSDAKITIKSTATLEEANEEEQSSKNATVRGTVNNTFVFGGTEYYALAKSGNLKQANGGVYLTNYRWAVKFNVPAGAKLRINFVGADGEDVTGIASAIAESLGAKAYSINGAQVDASNAKGVYIQNGKKFIRK